MIHPRTCWSLGGWKCALHDVEVEIVPDHGPYCHACNDYPAAPGLFRYWWQLLTFKRRIPEEARPA